MSELPAQANPDKDNYSHNICPGRNLRRALDAGASGYLLKDMAAEKLLTLGSPRPPADCG